MTAVPYASISAAPPITTSSFESVEVCRRRSERFQEVPAAALPGALEPYHNSVDPDNSAYSVRMRRPDAQTVSLSRIDVRPREAVFDYRPDDIDSLALHPWSHLTLERSAPPA